MILFLISSTLLSCCPAPVLRKDDYIRKKEAERIKKEEDDKRKAEEAEKKKTADAEKKAAAKQKEEEKREEERLAEEARKAGQLLPDISCSCIDVLLQPLEDRMDKVLGETVDPFTGRLLLT